MTGTSPSPVSLPVLAGAAVVSSPALWRALVEGSISLEVALSRYLVGVAVCWLALAVVAMLVGPTPRSEGKQDAGVEPRDEQAPGAGAGRQAEAGAGHRRS